MLIDEIYIWGVGIFYLIVFINLKYDKQIAYKKKKTSIFLTLTIIIMILNGSFFADGHFVDMLLVSDDIRLLSLVYFIICFYLIHALNKFK